MRKKVMIIYTGGTIGMLYTDAGLKVVPGLFCSQLNLLTPVTDIGIDLKEYDDLIDSSDITLEYLTRIINDITNFYDKYDGFIIATGTDTMAYTASFLSFALRGLNKPVVLTGAQLPLVHRRSDGWNNLSDALYSAAQPDLNEVVVAFNHKLLRGCRVKKISTDKFTGFTTTDGELLAEFGINISWYKKRWLKRKYSTFNPIIPLPAKVLNLSLAPGYTTDFIAETLEITDAKAVVLQTYGSGTIPMGHSKLPVAIADAVARGVMIVSITQVTEGRITEDYSNGKLGALGVVSGRDMTAESAIAKLNILLSMKLSPDRIKKNITKNLVGELTENYD
jgi:L-asparaginase